MKKLLSNYFICATVGGAAFVACYGLVKFITGSHYGGKSVGFLTLLSPLVTLILIQVWYEKILPKNKRGILAAILIGIIGPLVFIWLYSIVVIDVPAAKMAPLKTAKDFISFAGLSVVIGPLSVLTYSGMLGAMILNIIISPIMGWRLSKYIKDS